MMISFRTSSERHKVGVQSIVRKMIEKRRRVSRRLSGLVWTKVRKNLSPRLIAKIAEYKSVISGPPADPLFRAVLFLQPEEIHSPGSLRTSSKTRILFSPQVGENEVISKLNQGVEDLSISRATLKWGIPMPHDPEHVPICLD